MGKLLCAPLLALCTLLSACASVYDVRRDVARYDENKDATLQVCQVFPKTGMIGCGASVSVDSRGYVLTNSHVIEAIKNEATGKPERGIIAVCSPKDDKLSCISAQTIADDPALDLALVRIGQRTPTGVLLGDERHLSEGEPLAARLGIGPFLGPVLVYGRYLGTASPPLAPVTAPMLVLDMTAVPGSSGGPVFDGRGRMVALMQGVTDFGGRPVGLAIPAGTIRKFLEAHAPSPLEAFRKK